MDSHANDTLDSSDAHPSRVALISDIHSNLPALQAVLEDIRRSEVTSVWCLGDLVGYGAQPNECVELAASSCDMCLIGNHDLVCVERIDISRFSSHAAIAARWTREQLTPHVREFLLGLEPCDTTRQVGLYHASPRDPVWEYVLSVPQAEQCINAMEHPVGAIGHSHVALYFTTASERPATGDLAPAGTQLDLSEGRWLINPGAVGQPRDGDPRAGWLMLDFDSMTAVWQRVAYPIAEAAEAIRTAGLPQLLSERLHHGQ